jgi:beta-mannosidase
MELNLAGGGWELTGWRPQAWKLARSSETGFGLEGELGPVAATLPGTVQAALLAAGLVDDWARGFGSRALEWVEHRHWAFSKEVDVAPLRGERPGGGLVFEAESLDYSGWLLVNGRVAGTFAGPLLPVRIDLTAWIAADAERVCLTLVFDVPPEVDGQIGYTSRTRHFKPRYSYSWDWCPRFVPIGATGRLRLLDQSAARVDLLGLRAELAADGAHGHLHGQLAVDAAVPDGAWTLAVTVSGPDGQLVARTSVALQCGVTGWQLNLGPVARWWPIGMGEQVLYGVQLEVVDAAGRIVRQWQRQVGFKTVEWRANPGAPSDARPWLCVVNGRELFLQGVNWTPVRLGYQDTTAAEYQRLIDLYAAMGCNLLRVWGGAGLESDTFYALCDRAGLLVWQEFPLSSSGLDNRPPAEPAVIQALCVVARHYVQSRQHHAALLLWCGGNELQTGEEGGPRHLNRPCDEGDPCLAALGQVVAALDPGRRFVPTSPSGPVFAASPQNFGRGMHHHVHGPWGFGELGGMPEWKAYWDGDDSTLRSEVGMPSANALDLLQAHAGDAPLWPPCTAIWQHSASWWTQHARLTGLFAELPPGDALAAYVAHTRQEQAEALAYAAAACKARFPRCGGFVIWMGHDCYPCPANTSIIDYWHRPKPAYFALQAVFSQ